MVIYEKLRPEHSSAVTKGSKICKIKIPSRRVNIKDVNFSNSIEHFEIKVANLWSRLSSSPSDPDVKKEKKSVSFSNEKDVRQIPPLSTMSNSTIADCWFSPEDIETMKWEGQFLMYFEERGESEYIDHDSDSIRGLENVTEKGASQLLENRQYGYDAVLNEQKRQRREGIEDQLIIAQLYEASSKKIVDIALEIAKEDENVAHCLSQAHYQRHR